MSNFKDVTGQRFGLLTVIKRVKNDKQGNSKWLCKCDCGNEKIVRLSCLKRSTTPSCGCLTIKNIKKANTKHKLSKTRIYRIWKGMKHRCYCPSSNGYELYGGRGVTVCNEWNEFTPFYEWAKISGYQENLTIDRIDVNGNYEPSNCKWSTGKEQANNRRNNHIITYNGETHTLSEWANKYNIPVGLLADRVNRSHWTFEKAITTPKRLRNKHQIQQLFKEGE